jgi:hypothetical protein
MRASPSPSGIGKSPAALPEALLIGGGDPFERELCYGRRSVRPRWGCRKDARRAPPSRDPRRRSEHDIGPVKILMGDA